MMRVMAAWIIASPVSDRRSSSRARRRACPSQARVRSTCADRGPTGGAAKLGCEAGGWAARATLGEPPWRTTPRSTCLPVVGNRPAAKRQRARNLGRATARQSRRQVVSHASPAAGASQICQPDNTIRSMTCQGNTAGEPRIRGFPLLCRLLAHASVRFGHAAGDACIALRINREEPGTAFRNTG